MCVSQPFGSVCLLSRLIVNLKDCLEYVSLAFQKETLLVLFCIVNTRVLICSNFPEILSRHTQVTFLWSEAPLRKQNGRSYQCLASFFSFCTNSCSDRSTEGTYAYQLSMPLIPWLSLSESLSLRAIQVCLNSKVNIEKVWWEMFCIPEGLICTVDACLSNFLWFLQSLSCSGGLTFCYKVEPNPNQQWKDCIRHGGCLEGAFVMFMTADWWLGRKLRGILLFHLWKHSVNLRFQCFCCNITFPALLKNVHLLCPGFMTALLNTGERSLVYRSTWCDRPVLKTIGFELENKTNRDDTWSRDFFGKPLSSTRESITNEVTLCCSCPNVMAMGCAITKWKYCGQTKQYFRPFPFWKSGCCVL